MRSALPTAILFIATLVRPAPALAELPGAEFCRRWFGRLSQPVAASAAEPSPLDFFHELKGRRGALSLSEMETLAWRHFEKLVARIPRLEGRVNIRMLEQAAPGAYRISGPPPAALLREAHAFAGSGGELGFFSVRGQWFAVVSGEAKVEVPEPLASLIRRRGGSHVDLHTHPGRDAAARFPSFEDFGQMGATPDGAIHIAVHDGLLEIKPRTGGADPLLVRRAWEDWVRSNGVVRKEGESSWPYFERFLRESFQFRRIPWTEEAGIDHLLAERSRSSR